MELNAELAETLPNGFTVQEVAQETPADLEASLIEFSEMVQRQATEEGVSERAKATNLVYTIPGGLAKSTMF